MDEVVDVDWFVITNKYLRVIFAGNDAVDGILDADFEFEVGVTYFEAADLVFYVIWRI